MDYKAVAEQYTNNKSVQVPQLSVTHPPDMQVNTDELTEIMKRVEEGRTAAFTATKAVANGADPKTITSKCYMPDCYGTGFANFADFKDPINIKEYTISGMCQKCQDSFFD